METKQLILYLQSVSAAINGFTAINRESIEYVQMNEQRISNRSFEKLQTAKLCSVHIDQVLQALSYIILPSSTPDEDELTNFEIEDLIEKICLHFQNTISEHTGTSIQHFSRLDRSFSILINKQKFEFLILNILHCCLKGASDGSKRTPKISFYVTETKKDIVFHIRDYGTTIGADFAETAFSFSAPPFIEDFSDSVISSLNLSVAQKAAHEMNGSVRYSPLKSGNRFDIFIPKPVKIPVKKLYSLAQFSLDTELYDKIMNDIIIEPISVKKDN